MAVNTREEDWMPTKWAVATVSTLAAKTGGVFRGGSAVALGVSRNQLRTLADSMVIERVLPDTCRIASSPATSEQRLRAALLWAGPDAAATGRSAAELYGLEGVRAAVPEIAVPLANRARTTRVGVVHGSRAAFMVRRVRGIPATGLEFTLLRLAATLDEEAFEIACEDARRRRLTSVSALDAYLERFARSGRPGVAPLRALLHELDPTHAARSVLEVKTRRLLTAHGMTGFAREFPLEWRGRAYL
jgi:hypothetical protein